MHEHHTTSLDSTADNGKVKTSPLKPALSASAGEALQTLDISIGGMTCPHCPAAIEKALRKLEGVHQANVNLATGMAHIAFEPARIAIPSLLNAIRSAGYVPGAAKIRIPIKNMHCSSCVTRIELALKLTPGVVSARAGLGTNAADVEYLPDQTSFAALRQAIETAGYRVAEPKPPTTPEEEELGPEETAQREEYRTLMRKFWFAAVIAVPVMALSYPDLIPGLREWMPAGSDTRRIVWALLGLASLPVLVWSGSQFFTGMWERQRPFGDGPPK